MKSVLGYIYIYIYFCLEMELLTMHENWSADVEREEIEKLMTVAIFNYNIVIFSTHTCMSV
jgi:hypothetical protein